MKPGAIHLNHAWYLAGNAAYDSGQVSRALEFFKKSVKAWPDDVQALMAVAYCYSELNKPRWAAHYLEKAVEIDPNNSHLKYNLANSYFDMKKYPEASKLYRKVVKMNKGEVGSWAAGNLKATMNQMRSQRTASRLTT